MRHIIIQLFLVSLSGIGETDVGAGATFSFTLGEARPENNAQAT